jgi:hypothetical protein
LAVAALAFGLPGLVWATTPIITPNYSLKEQLQRADLVGFVSIRAAEVGDLQPATYRAQMMDSVKGAEQSFCFTLPRIYGGLQIGLEYLIFLIRESKPDPEAVARLGCPSGTPSYQVGERFSSPLAIQFTRDVRQLCPSENCAFGEWALQIGAYADLPEFAVTYPVPGVDRMRWIRRSQLLRALRFQLARDAE